MVAKKKTIVLVEDEKTIANLIELRLKRAGYEVKVVHDGQEGLDAIFSSAPDLVLLDMLLPGLSGFDILKKLKEKQLLPDLPVIIISNSVQPIQLERAIDMGARDYLIKVNFTPDVVVEKVDAIFEQKLKVVSPGARRILLVEDEKILADSIERTFVKKQHQIFKAANAREAKKVLKDENIDLILLDIILPDVDGFKLLDEFKQDDATKDIPVVIISNLGQREEIEKGENAGATDYIIKSDTQLKDLIKKISILLRRTDQRKIKVMAG